MEDSKIIYLQDNPYIAVIVYLDGVDIIKELLILNTKKNIKAGTYLIDCLLILGNTADRFIEIEHDGERFLTEAAKSILIDRRNLARVESCKYLRKEREIVNNSILTSVQKKLLLQGVTI